MFFTGELRTTKKTLYNIPNSEQMNKTVKNFSIQIEPENFNYEMTAVDRQEFMNRFCFIFYVAIRMETMYEALFYYYKYGKFAGVLTDGINHMLASENLTDSITDEDVYLGCQSVNQVVTFSPEGGEKSSFADYRSTT